MYIVICVDNNILYQIPHHTLCSFHLCKAHSIHNQQLNVASLSLKANRCYSNLIKNSKV